MSLKLFRLEFFFCNPQKKTDKNNVIDFVEGSQALRLFGVLF